MADLDQILSDPDYQALSSGEQMNVRRSFYRQNVAADPDYQALKPEEKARVTKSVIFPGSEEPGRFQKLMTGPVGEGIEFTGSAASRLAPFKGGIDQPFPTAITDPIVGGIDLVRKHVSHNAAKLIEDTMASIPVTHGAFAGPRKLRALSGETQALRAARPATRAGEDLFTRKEPAFVDEIRGQVGDLNPEQAARAEAIDTQLTAADRLRQSPRGNDLLRQDLLERERQAPVEVEPPVARETIISPQAQTRTSDLLSAAEEQLRPKAAGETSRTLEAAKETTLGREPASALAERAGQRGMIREAKIEDIVANSDFQALAPAEQMSVKQAYVDQVLKTSEKYTAADGNGKAAAEKAVLEARPADVQPELIAPKVLTADQVVQKIEGEQNPKYFDKAKIENQVAKGGETYVKTEVDPTALTVPGEKSVEPGVSAPEKGPIVVNVEGKVIDGRHRVVDAKVQGEKAIEAYVPDQPTIPLDLSTASITDLVKKGFGSETGAAPAITGGKLAPEQVAAESSARSARGELYRRVTEEAAKTGETIDAAARRLSVSPPFLARLQAEQTERVGPVKIRDGQPVEAPTVGEVQDAVEKLTKPVSFARLLRGGLSEESSITLTRTMGKEGGDLARLSKAVRNDSEIEAGIATQRVGESLQNLNQKQLDSLVDVLDRGAKPIDDVVTQAAAVARGELDKVAARAMDVKLEIKNPITGEKTPFQPRENYFPHMFGKELGEVAKTENGRAMLKQQIKAELEKSGRKVTDGQVAKALVAMLKASKMRNAHLEIARIFDLGGYSKDPKTVLTKHFNDAYRRINIAEKFGPDLEGGENLLTEIGLKKGDRAESFARSYFQRVTRTEPGGSAVVKEGVNFATNFQAFSKLGQAVISNLSQPAYTAIVAGAKNAIRGYAHTFTKEGKVFAERTGAILNDTMTDFLKDSGARTDTSVMGKAADFVLEKTGFTAVERLNRVMSANIGRYFAREMFEKVQKYPGNKRFRATLEKLNVDVDAALERKSLSELDEIRAGQSIVNRTQFKTDVTEIPLFWSSDAGRLLTQFKKFQFKAGQMVYHEILGEMRKGNVKPFLRAAAILPGVGYLTMTAKDAIRFGRQREHEATIADYLATVGTFGAFADAFSSYGRQPVKGLQYLAGPTLGDAGAAWEAAFIEAPKGNWRPTAKFFAGHVPVVGPSLRSLFNEDKGERDRRLSAISRGGGR